jgi:translocation and assembly module TamA
VTGEAGSLDAPPRALADPQAAATPASDPASTTEPVPATVAAPDAFRYRVVIDAPAPLQSLIARTVGLVRWQDYADMTSALFDRIVREAVTQSSDAAASLGWFSATTDINVDTSTAPATVTLRVVTGAPTIIRSVNLDVEGPAATDVPLGVDAIARMRNEWLLAPGDTFTQAGWDTAKNRAVFTLDSSGYPATQITASEAFIDPYALAGDLTMTLASGPLFHFGDLLIQGLVRYPPSLVQNFSTLKRGDRYDARALDQFVRRLNGSGYFASVQATIDTNPEHAEDAPVTLAVIEAPTKRLELGLGFSTDTLFRVSARYTDVNSDDHGLQFAADLRIEQKLQSGSLQWVWPPDDSHWITSTTTEVERTDIENLITETASIGARRQTVDERDNWTWGAAMYFDNQRPLDAPAIRSHALYPSVVRTWRRTDDLIAPTRGYNFSLEIGGGIPGASTLGFGRVIAQWAGWYPINRDWAATARAEGGAVFASSREGVPSALLFRTGGDTTVRGYAYESLGVQSGSAIVPGRYYAVASGEVVRWINQSWGIAGFVDAGNAVDAPSELSNLALGYGLGARVRTPIGPFRLDVAYGQEDHRVRLHMSVGLSF